VFPYKTTAAGIYTAFLTISFNFINRLNAFNYTKLRG